MYVCRMENLRVEERARELAVGVYRATARFPRTEQLALVQQMRRSAVSVGSNIAEGCGRNTDKEFARFVDIAVGSVRELLFQLTIARELGFLDDTEHRALSDSCEAVRAMLISLKRKLA